MNPVVLLYQIGCKGQLLKLVGGEDDTSSNWRIIEQFTVFSLLVRMFRCLQASCHLIIWYLQDKLSQLLIWFRGFRVMRNIQKIKPCVAFCGIAKELHPHGFKGSPKRCHLVAHIPLKNPTTNTTKPREGWSIPKKHLDTTTSSSIHAPVLCKTIP